MIGTVALDPEQLIKDSSELGSPPMVYRRLMEVINDPRAGAAGVSEVIQQDPALTARLLRLVNSAFFSFGRPIDTVFHAVNVVGTSQLRDLALATSVTALFRDVPPELVHAEDFWRHSLACGVGARVLARFIGEANVERFFVAGMLHDLGRLVLYLRAPEESKAILAHAQKRGTLLYQAERELAGFDHAAIGGALMDHWKMPESLKESVRLHHDPLEATRYPVEAATVHLADILANALQLGSSGERFVSRLSPEAWDRLSMNPRVMPSVVEEMERQYVDAVSLFGLGAEG